MSRDITRIKHHILKDPPFHVVLYQPEIPSNTGNIARLCAAAEVTLHLIHPLGFTVDDKRLKRAGLDYWYEVDVRHYPGFETFLETMRNTGNIIAFSTHAPELYTKVNVCRGDYLLFGPETSGLPLHIQQKYPCYALPIRGNVRSLNLSTTVGIVTYHYLHQMEEF